MIRTAALLIVLSFVASPATVAACALTCASAHAQIDEPGCLEHAPHAPAHVVVGDAGPHDCHRLIDVPATILTVSQPFEFVADVVRIFHAAAAGSVAVTSHAATPPVPDPLLISTQLRI